MTEFQTFFIILGILLSPVYGIGFYLIKRLNYTCGMLGKIVTFLKIVHPNKANSLD